MQNVFKVKSNDTRMTSMTFSSVFIFYFPTDLAHSSGVSVSDFGRVNDGSVDEI